MIPPVAPLRQEWPEAFARRYREAGYWRGETFPGFLRQRAAEHPDAVAIVDGARHWTYRHLWERAERHAARSQASTAAEMPSLSRTASGSTHRPSASS